MRKSIQLAMGSLLTNRRIVLYFHSAIARMSESEAVANGTAKSSENKLVFRDIRRNERTLKTNKYLT